jgi:hypothetical protein
MRQYSWHVFTVILPTNGKKTSIDPVQSPILEVKVQHKVKGKVVVVHITKAIGKMEV